METSWRADQSRSTQSMASLFKHVVGGRVWMEFEMCSSEFSDLLFVTVGFVHSRWRYIVTDECVDRNTHTFFFSRTLHVWSHTHRGSRCPTCHPWCHMVERIWFKRTLLLCGSFWDKFQRLADAWPWSRCFRCETENVAALAFLLASRAGLDTHGGRRCCPLQPHASDKDGYTDRLCACRDLHRDRFVFITCDTLYRSTHQHQWWSMWHRHQTLQPWLSAARAAPNLQAFFVNPQFHITTVETSAPRLVGAILHFGRFWWAVNLTCQEQIGAWETTQSIEKCHPVQGQVKIQKIQSCKFQCESSNRPRLCGLRSRSGFFCSSDRGRYCRDTRHWADPWAEV